MALKIQFTGAAANLLTAQINKATAAGNPAMLLVIPAGSERVGSPGTESYAPEQALLPDMIRVSGRRLDTDKKGEVVGDGLNRSRAGRGQRYAAIEANPDGSVTVTANGKAAETLRRMLGDRTDTTVHYVLDPRPSSPTYGAVFGGESVCFDPTGPSLGLGGVTVLENTPEADLADPWANVVPGKRGGGVIGSRAEAALKAATIRFTDVMAAKFGRDVQFIGNLSGAKVAFDPSNGSVNAVGPAKLAAGKPMEMSADQIRQAAEAYVAKATEAGTPVDDNWHNLIASLTPAAAEAAATETATQVA